MPQDAIVLGPRLQQGENVEVERLGTVRFIDDSVQDDKAITSKGGKIGLPDSVRIRVFFTIYAVFKILRYLLMEKRLAKCAYMGYVRGGGTGLLQ